MLVWDWNNIEILAHFHGTGTVWMQRSSLFSPLKIVSFQPSSIFIHFNISFSLVGCSLTLPTITHLPLRTVYIYSDKKAARTLLVLLPCDFNRLGLVNACQRDLWSQSSRGVFLLLSVFFVSCRSLLLIKQWIVYLIWRWCHCGRLWLAERVANPGPAGEHWPPFPLWKRTGVSSLVSTNLPFTYSLSLSLNPHLCSFHIPYRVLPVLQNL